MALILGGTMHGQEWSGSTTARVNRMTKRDGFGKDVHPIEWETYFLRKLGCGRTVWAHTSLDTTEKIEAAFARLQATTVRRLGDAGFKL